MSEIDPRRRAVAAWTLLFARAAYAFNWYDIGGVLPLVGDHFQIGTFDRGVLLAVFLVGAAVFQLPAGYAAMRWGNGPTSIGALAAMAAFALASAFSPSWVVLAALRFGAGAAAAFFFAPALGLIASYYPSGRRGFMIGAYNAAFSVGSGIGLFASAALGPTVGWALPLAVGGVALAVCTVTTIVFLPRLPEPTTVRASALWRDSLPVLRSRGIWAVALGGAGLWGGYYIAAQYFVNYAHTIHPAWSLALAATAPTVMIAVEVAGGPFGGWSGERSPDRRRLLAAWGIVAGLVLVAVPWVGLYAVLTLYVLLGFTAGVTFALLYLIPMYLPEVSGSRVALGLALVNFVQILLGSGMALGFAGIASSAGYGYAWLFAGVGSVAFLPALLFARGPPKPAGPPALPARERGPRDRQPGTGRRGRPLADLRDLFL